LNSSPDNRFERRKQRTRSQLMQAAISLILEKGYDAVTVEDITERADLGRGTFYVHFENKEQLVWKAIQQGFDALNADVLTRYAHEESPRLEYLVWIRMFEYAATERDLFQVMMGGRGSALLSERIEEYLVQIVEESVRSGRFFPHLRLDPVLIAQFWVGALIRMMKWWLAQPPPAPYTATQMVDFVYQMIFHQEPPSR
jgi:AcrR family transcriptional regulator